MVSAVFHRICTCLDARNEVVRGIRRFSRRADAFDADAESGPGEPLDLFFAQRSCTRTCGDGIPDQRPCAESAAVSHIKLHHRAEAAFRLLWQSIIYPQGGGARIHLHQRAGDLWRAYWGRTLRFTQLAAR